MNVPTIPKLNVYPIYLKNDFLLRLYPAENIIGGNMKLKKTASSKYKVLAKFV
jgi:hypothetical protein